MRRAVRAGVLACVLVGCDEVPPTGIDASAGARDAAREDVFRVRCTMESVEDCARCYANVGRCCYMDETIGGNVDALAANCEGAPACRSCCSECAAMTCDALRASHRCPF